MNGIKCLCGKIALYKENLEFEGYTLPGWQCKQCGEEYYDSKHAEPILIKLKNGHDPLGIAKAKKNSLPSSVKKQKKKVIA